MNLDRYVETPKASMDISKRFKHFLMTGKDLEPLKVIKNQQTGKEDDPLKNLYFHSSETFFTDLDQLINLIKIYKNQKIISLEDFCNLLLKRLEETKEQGYNLKSKKNEKIQNCYRRY